MKQQTQKALNYTQVSMLKMFISLTGRQFGPSIDSFQTGLPQRANSWNDMAVWA